jgi:hypothetical protein
MARTQPEITAPVSRGQLASIGVVQNIGTAQGSNSNINGLGGFVNNSLGGVVDRGVQSFSNAAVSPSATIKDASTGSSKAVTTSSTNPQSIQDDSSADVNGEKVAQTTSAAVSSPANGYYSNLTRSQVDVELPVNLPGAVRTVSATMAADVTISQKGVETSRVTGSVDDKTINQNLVDTAEANAPEDHWQNGAAFSGPFGLPTSSIQDRSDAEIQPGPHPVMPTQNGTAA